MLTVVLDPQTPLEGEYNDNILFEDNVWLQFCSQLLQFPLKNKIIMATYFENLTIGLHILYVDMYVKFRANWMLFIIQSINFFLSITLDYKNLKFKHLIDDIVIDL